MISATDQYKALVAKLEAINPSNVTENMEAPVEECGDMMAMAPKQQDNVTMNVTAQGAGGIRDLMNLLHSMEAASSDEVVVGNPGGEIEIPVADENIDGGFGGATTRPKADTFGVDDVVKKGTDIHSKGDEAEKVNGGGNPFNVDESLLARLANHYESIKEGEKKTMSRAAKGHEKYGKEGMAALAKAGKEGKDLDKIRDKYNKYD